MKIRLYFFCLQRDTHKQTNRLSLITRALVGGEKRRMEKVGHNQKLLVAVQHKYQQEWDSCVLSQLLTFNFACLIVVTATSELPAFLTRDGGLNSGFMMAQVTAAALG